MIETLRRWAKDSLSNVHSIPSISTLAFVSISSASLPIDRSFHLDHLNSVVVDPSYIYIYIYSATCCWCALPDIAYCLCLEDILTSKSGSDETNKDNTNQETLGHDVPHIWAVGGLAQNKCEDGASSYDQFGIFDSWIQLASPLDSSNQIRLDNSPLPRWFFPAS